MNNNLFVHDARLEIENFLDKISVKETDEFYTKMTQMSHGGNLISFFKVTHPNDKD